MKNIQDIRERFLMRPLLLDPEMERRMERTKDFYFGITDEIVMCKKVRYGANGNFVRFQPVENPSRKQIKNLLLKIIRMKNV